MRLQNADHALKVGMFAEARIHLAVHENALVVPPSAIVRGENGANVYVVTGDTAARTAVKTGIEQRNAIEIVDGVHENQVVLTSAVYGLGEKAKLAK